MRKLLLTIIVLTLTLTGCITLDLAKSVGDWFTPDKTDSVAVYPWVGTLITHCTIDARRDTKAGTKEVYQLATASINSQQLTFKPHDLPFGKKDFGHWQAGGRVFFMCLIDDNWYIHTFGGWLRADSNSAASNEFWHYSQIDGSGAEQIWVAIGSPHNGDGRRTNWVRVK